MTDYNFLYTTIASGVLSATIAALTARFAIRQFSHQKNIKRHFARLDRMEALYSDSIATMSNMLGSVYEKRNDSIDLETIHAQIELFGSSQVLAAVDEWQEVFQNWAADYVRGEPRVIGDSGIAIIGSPQTSFRISTKEKFPKVHETGGKVILQCRLHLRALSDR